MSPLRTSTHHIRGSVSPRPWGCPRSRSGTGFGEGWLAASPCCPGWQTHRQTRSRTTECSSSTLPPALREGGPPSKRRPPSQTEDLIYHCREEKRLLDVAFNNIRTNLATRFNVVILLTSIGIPVYIEYIALLTFKIISMSFISPMILD